VSKTLIDMIDNVTGVHFLLWRQVIIHTLQLQTKGLSAVAEKLRDASHIIRKRSCA